MNEADLPGTQHNAGLNIDLAIQPETNKLILKTRSLLAQLEHLLDHTL